MWEEEEEPFCVGAGVLRPDAATVRTQRVATLHITSVQVEMTPMEFGVSPM